MKRILFILAIVMAAFIGGILGVIYTLRYVSGTPEYASIQERQRSSFARFGADSLAAPDFHAAANSIAPAVVHISTIYGPGDFSINPLEQYFKPQARSSGSGVIVSDDGYIVTNNHVIEDATSIEVVMTNNQKFYAKIIGRDPSTDLALLKIRARALPFVRYGNSDQVSPGDWVLAIGNPFDLNSTVTAGIVSAKARNIGILRDRNNLQVESFIQTDAAVNPGNSGGALVNLRGELIGINSAIATATGSYSGYSFAIPVNLVKKVADDLLEFGEVQRGLLGVQITDVTSDLAEDQHLDVVRGIFITRVNHGSAAAESGMKEGDVIVAIDKQQVGTVSELQELVARHRPGHQINVTYRRDSQEKTVQVTLRNYEGEAAVQHDPVSYQLEGAHFEDLSYSDLAKYSIDGGAYVKKLEPGRWKKSGMRENYIITHIDKVQIDNVEDLNRVMSYKSGSILVEGKYRDGDKASYAVEW